jgi:ABC-type antimicrobial peptide transport system permease subunit
VAALDPALPIFDVETLTDHLGLALFPARLAAAILGSFGLLALVLAGIGVYGVISYGVSQRTREIGIRMALGADKSDILRSVVGQGLLLAGIGLGLGLAISVMLTRFLGRLLYGVSPTDSATFAGVFLLLALIAAIASYIPGRRATGIDPMSALRYE